MRLSRQHRWLLLAALAPAPRCVEAWQAWAASVDLDAADHAAQRLLPLVWRNLGEHGAAGRLPGRVVGLHRQAWSRNRLALRRLEDALGALRRDGLGAVVLDDAGLLLACYPDAGCRTLRGFDLLVAPGDAPGACAALGTGGWRPRGSRRCAFAHAVQYAIELQAADGARLRLHRYGLRDEWSEPSIEARLRAGAREVALGAARAHVLAPAPALVRLLGRPAWWEPSGATEWIADVALLLRTAGDGLDWDDALHLAARIGATGALAEALAMACALVPASVPADVRVRLAGHRPRGLERLAGPGRGPVARLVARHGLEYWRLARRAGLAAALGGYPRYLQHRWDLASAGEVPRAAVGRAGNLARAALRRVGPRP